MLVFRFKQLFGQSNSSLRTNAAKMVMPPEVSFPKKNPFVFNKLKFLDALNFSLWRDFVISMLVEDKFRSEDELH